MTLCECVLIWNRTTFFMSRSGRLFLMNLCWLWSVSQYTSEVMVLLCSRNWTNSGPWVSKNTVSNTLPADTLGKQGLHDTKIDVEVWCTCSVPFAGQWVAWESSARTFSDNEICSEQLSKLFQRWLELSPPTFVMWNDNHFSLSRVHYRFYSKKFPKVSK